MYGSVHVNLDEVMGDNTTVMTYNVPLFSCSMLF